MSTNMSALNWLRIMNEKSDQKTIASLETEIQELKSKIRELEIRREVDLNQIRDLKQERDFLRETLSKSKNS